MQLWVQLAGFCSANRASAVCSPNTAIPNFGFVLIGLLWTKSDKTSHRVLTCLCHYISCSATSALSSAASNI